MVHINWYDVDGERLRMKSRAVWEKKVEVEEMKEELSEGREERDMKF